MLSLVDWKEKMNRALEAIYDGAVPDNGTWGEQYSMEIEHIVEDVRMFFDNMYNAGSHASDYEIAHLLIDCESQRIGNFELSKHVRFKELLGVAAEINAELKSERNENSEDSGALWRKFKNNTERQDFLKNYNKWDLLYTNPFTKEQLYKFFVPETEDVIIVKQYLTYIEWHKRNSVNAVYYLCNKGTKNFEDGRQSLSQMVEYIKDVQKNK